jgi:exodeoxyribonuclease-3
MIIATWNVNSLKVRLPQVLEWLAHYQPDVLCLQETKTEDANFQLAELTAAAYQCAFSGQKTYNGVAILSKQPLQEITYGIPGCVDTQKRVLAATINGVRIVNVYVPNGQSVDSDKYQYKLAWLKELTAWLEVEVKTHPQLALLGDYNIAPEDRDVHDPQAWQGQVLVSAPERAAFQALLNLGLQDSFRLFEQPEKIFSWWDYRMNAFRRNRGLRIDHILLSAVLASACKATHIDKEARKAERPSDHAPVITELNLKV